jgi:hypothetical protein
LFHIPPFSSDTQPVLRHFSRYAMPVSDYCWHIQQSVHGGSPPQPQQEFPGCISGSYLHHLPNGTAAADATLPEIVQQLSARGCFGGERSAASRPDHIVSTSVHPPLCCGEDCSSRTRSSPALDGPTMTRLGCRAKRRRPYSRQQIAFLENEFMCSPYIGRHRRWQLSCALRLTERQVKVWFQNRRMKSKKISDRATLMSIDPAIKHFALY